MHNGHPIAGARFLAPAPAGPQWQERRRPVGARFFAPAPGGPRPDGSKYRSRRGFAALPSASPPFRVCALNTVLRAYARSKAGPIRRLSAQPPVLRPSEAEGSAAKRLLFSCAPVFWSLRGGASGGGREKSRPYQPLHLQASAACLFVFMSFCLLTFYV